MADTCGAKTRSGQPCKTRPVLGGSGRCRMHGGKKSGAPIQHGFYADALLPEERVLWERVELGGLDDEIRLMRVKLHRLVRLSGNADVAELVDSALEVAQKYDEHPKFGGMEKREIRVKTARYGELIIQAIEAIRKLELARRELARVDPNTPPPPQEPITEFRVTVVTPENFNPDQHGPRS